MPLPYLLLELSSPAAVAASRAEVPEGFGEVYVWAWEEPERSVRARFFAPEAGVMEDPATGSAAVALAAALRARGGERGSLLVYQGEEMGHPSTLHLVWDGDTASVGGSVREDGVRVLET
jgi:trans-2,3-dihydro-3-hydroxyanthranilate isomerase